MHMSHRSSYAILLAVLVSVTMCLLTWDLGRKQGMVVKLDIDEIPVE